MSYSIFLNLLNFALELFTLQTLKPLKCILFILLRNEKTCTDENTHNYAYCIVHNKLCVKLQFKHLQRKCAHNKHTIQFINRNWDTAGFKCWKQLDIMPYSAFIQGLTLIWKHFNSFCIEELRRMKLNISLSNLFSLTYTACTYKIF